ncbi:hypothetical protein BDZ94DRAFT_662341 [Collybia nuda]|uniref:Uncharacterized protein n=1 Tax=Collybia nuda TaxID=64659 RepID=A0A9P5XPZ5_9AGAR|nr:hypothetical protein BDZ94DRAFT_662341 [Collybia nuda]
MDPMVVDTDAPPQSKSDADLALYLATSNTNTSGPGLLPWNAADNDYGFGHNTLGLYDASDDLGYSWSEEEANRYIVANHPLVEHETELSDHSYTTDSGSRNSSNQYSDPSFINHTENGETLLPPLRMGSPRPSGILLPDSHFSMYLPPPTPRARFLGSSGPNVLPHPRSSPQDTELLLLPLRDLLVNHPSPLSSTSSPHPPSSHEGQFISPEEISAACGSRRRI